MNGDSADPIIADALAMGVRNFDVPLALKYMVKGATENETGHGLEIERQYLSQYLSQHYVNAGSLDLTSIDYSIGGSVTLEYAIDDFAIAQVASAQHNSSVAAPMLARAANWEYLFNPAVGYIQARGTDGSFPSGSAFEASQLEPGGQTGFEEGNAVQYTWSVPQDLAALASLMGGDAAAAAKLGSFMASLNATRNVPEDWSGNEPDEWAPWEFDFFGAPDETQRFVRDIADSEYADAPVDEPGNDDLGALSSWYVWAAIGLFPVTPGSANLSLASPLFPSVVITLPSGRHLVEQAPGATASRPYVHTLGLGGHASRCHEFLVRQGDRSPHVRRELGYAVAACFHPQHGRDPALHALRHRRPCLGLRSRRRATFLRIRPASGRGLLGPERHRHVDGRTADIDCPRCGSGRERRGNSALAGRAKPRWGHGDALFGQLHGHTAPGRERCPWRLQFRRAGHPGTQRDGHRRWDRSPTAELAHRWWTTLPPVVVDLQVQP